MTRDVTRYVVDADRPAVSYGPSRHTEGDAWVLSLSTGDERLELVLDERPMYDLWVEARGAPFPNPLSDRDRAREDRLVRQLVHAANDADEAMLEDALEALGVGDV